MNNGVADEQALDPEQPIIDPHLHLWDIPAAPDSPQLPQRFLLQDAIATVARSGHHITHTVFVECHAMYRQDGPEAMRPVGETEFANGMAAMSASGLYGPCRMAHRIVGSADLLLGSAVAPILEAQVAAAGERFRGIRAGTAFSETGLFGFPCDRTLQGRLRDPRFQAGAQTLAAMGLSLDVWCLHTQLDELAELADKVPDLTIVLDHVGTPVGLGASAGRDAQLRAQWKSCIEHLARRPNVLVKLGGMGMDISAPIGSVVGTANSGTLADRWLPYIETCIEAFSPGRCMFESNFPPDSAAGSYGATWNAFKIIARRYSPSEKDQLFRITAARTYRIELRPDT